MATKIKRHHRRKDLLKAPDEFLSFTEHAIEWSRDNWPLVIIGAGALVIAGVVWLLIQSSAEAGREQFQASFREAMNTFQAPVQIEGMPPMQGLVTYPTEKDKYEAAQFKLEKLAREHPDSVVSPYIGMYMADSLLEQGKYDEAIDKYREIRRKFSQLSDIALLTRHNEAIAMYKKEEYKKAFAIFGELADNKSPLNKASSLVYAGRCAERLGETKKAIDYYQRAVDGYSDSVLTKGLEAKIKKLKMGAKP